MSFEVVKTFEKSIAKHFGAPYGVAVDCCTHGIELCLRRNKDKVISVPHRTYISVPFLTEKLGINLVWKNVEWKDYYYLTNEIIDAAVEVESDFSNLPPRKVESQYKRELAEKNTTKELIKKAKVNAKQKVWYMWRKRAKAVGITPLKGRRPTPNQRKEWEESIVRAEEG